MNTIFRTNSTNSKDRTHSHAAAADQGNSNSSSLSQTAKDVCSSLFPFSKSHPSLRSSTDSKGCVEWKMSSTSSRLVVAPESHKDDDDDDAMVKQDDVAGERNGLLSSFRDDVSDPTSNTVGKDVVKDEGAAAAAGSATEKKHRDRRPLFFSQPAQRLYNCMSDTVQPLKTMTMKETEQDGAQQKKSGEADAGSCSLVDLRNKSGVHGGDEDVLSQQMMTSNQVMAQKTSTSKKKIVLAELRDDVEVVGRGKENDQQLTGAQDRSCTFVFDFTNNLKHMAYHGDETKCIPLFPKSALRTADGTTVVRSSQRLVSFAPMSQQQYHRDPFRKSRFDYKSELWHSPLDMKNALVNRNESIQKLRQSKAPMRVLQRLWKRQRQDMALDSPLTKHLLLQLVYHQVGKRMHLHCVGMEVYCFPLMIRQRRQELRNAVLQAQRAQTTSPSTSSWEYLSRVSMHYSENSRAFASAVGKALDMAVVVEDRLVRNEDDDDSNDE